jgi:hypothetical protein
VLQVAVPKRLTRAFFVEGSEGDVREGVELDWRGGLL